MHQRQLGQGIPAPLTRHTAGLVVAAVEDMVVVHLTQLIPAGDVDDHAKVRALVYQAIVD